VSHKNRDKGRLAPFVPLLKETLQSPAWKATSHGARSLYVALKARYNLNSHNNGHIYLPQRIAADEIGSKTDQVTRWFRELQHFGFTVMTNPGCLGVDGKGRAPTWRLTELGHMKDQPTRDFLRWNGEPFVDSKKQNPVPENGDVVSPKRGTVVSLKTGTRKAKSVPEKGDKGNGAGVPEKGDKSILTTCNAKGGAYPRLVWSTPVVTEVPWDSRLAALAA
jgi:hypothetical protein